MLYVLLPFGWTRGLKFWIVLRGYVSIFSRNPLYGIDILRAFYMNECRARSRRCSPFRITWSALLDCSPWPALPDRSFLLLEVYRVISLLTCFLSLWFVAVVFGTFCPLLHRLLSSLHRNAVDRLKSPVRSYNDLVVFVFCTISHHPHILLSSLDKTQ